MKKNLYRIGPKKSISVDPYSIRCSLELSILLVWCFDKLWASFPENKDRCAYSVWLTFKLGKKTNPWVFSLINIDFQLISKQTNQTQIYGPSFSAS